MSMLVLILAIAYMYMCTPAITILQSVFRSLYVIGNGCYMQVSMVQMYLHAHKLRSSVST